MAKDLRDLEQLRLVVRDLWLELGGCSVCRGLVVLPDGSVCGNPHDAGVDPTLTVPQGANIIRYEIKTEQPPQVYQGRLTVPSRGEILATVEFWVHDYKRFMVWLRQAKP